MRANRFVGLSAMLAAAVASVMALQAGGQGMQVESPSPASAARVVPSESNDPVIAKIREEGMQRSQVMATLNYLTNVIGPRLTASVNAKKANEWTRDQMSKWGLTNAHLESWAFGGRGWTVKRFTMQVTEPLQITPIAYPKAWSPGLDKPIVADVVLVDARTEEDLQKYHGKLKGAVVLSGGPRTIGPAFSPLARRLTDADLERFATARAGANLDTQGTRLGVAATAAAAGGRGAATTSGPARGFGGSRGGGGGLAPGRVIAFLMEEGAALQLTVTSGSEMAMTVGQGAVTLPTASNAAAGGAGRGDGAATASAPAGGGRGRGAGGRGGPNAYSPNAPATLPQVTVSVEGYNRLVRAAQQGVPLKMEVEMKVEFTSNDDLNAFNTIAEIPGSDLKDEVVMLGAHLDSWHMGTGATDNGTGVSECMEAMRILNAIGAKPRRTIRVVGSSRVDLQACKLEYSIVSPK